VATGDELQGRRESADWWERLIAAVDDGPHAVVTVGADIEVDEVLPPEDAAQVQRLRIFFAEQFVVRATSWPHDPDSDHEARAAKVLLDSVGSTLSEWQPDPIDRQAKRLLLRLRSRAPANVIEAALDLVDHNECAIALEDLAEHLFEHEVALSADDIERFALLAQRMRLRKERWGFIRRLGA